MKDETRPPDPALARQYFADKVAFTTGPVELNRSMNGDDRINVLDVRAAEDFAQGHIPGAHNLPHEKWPDTSVLRADCVNILYCYSAQCHLAAAAAVQFAEKGFSVMEMDGGFDAWKENNLPIEK